MTWTKLILILAIGVALAGVLWLVVPSRPSPINFYSTNLAAQNTVRSWVVEYNQLAFWLCLIVTLVVVAVLGGRILLRS
jgi:hypothetical protein